MARINFDDDVESQNGFWELMKIYNDRDLCLGKLVRLFRIAQHRYGHRQVLTKADLSMQGLEVMIEVGWVLPSDDGGYQVFNPEKYFGWYRQKCEAALLGGRPSRAKRESNKNNDVTKPKENPGNRSTDPENPLSLSLSLSLSKKKELLGGSDESPPAEFAKYAELFAARKISAKLQRLWLEKFSAEFVLEKVAALLIWEETAGAKGRKQNWGKFYSGCFGRDWDKWIARHPNPRSANAPSGSQRAQTAHSAPESNWVKDLFEKEKIHE